MDRFIHDKIVGTYNINFKSLFSLFFQDQLYFITRRKLMWLVCFYACLVAFRTYLPGYLKTFGTMPCVTSTAAGYTP